jgi:hypothetical protein
MNNFIQCPKIDKRLRKKRLRLRLRLRKKSEG